MKVLALLAIVFFAGCSSGTPDCGDSETLKILEKVVETTLNNHRSLTPQNKEVVDGARSDNSFVDVQALNYSEAVDRYSCRASLQFKSDKHTIKFPFDYEVFTDQSDGETVVEYPERFAKDALFRFLATYPG